MTAKRLKSIRTSALHFQSGGCFYRGLPMWLAAPSELGLRPRNARAFQCTAEHLVAQQDGGLDTPENIVAACIFCNQRRHKRRGPAPAPELFRAHVQRRLSRGKWHGALRVSRPQGQGTFGAEEICVS
ncbi:HNH endonuclease [Stenotrophomonas rhizophila]|uniref:HNH endonuclease n=1 Tax=Stenotrophomonas rhizophila TaxID=216778 RepID=UPI00286E0564|nr:HNH endonuclease [Stenotrophomonas rhizophila]